MSTAAIIYSMFFCWESPKKLWDVTSEHGGLKFKGTRMGVQIYKWQGIREWWHVSNHEWIKNGKIAKYLAKIRVEITSQKGYSRWISATCNLAVSESFASKSHGAPTPLVPPKFISSISPALCVRVAWLAEASEQIIDPYITNKYRQ